MPTHGKTQKMLNPEDTRYYRMELARLLQACTPGEDHYTHHFHYGTGSRFQGSGSRRFLLRCLRTLEAKGYIRNHDLGFHIYKWSITEQGKQFVADYDPLKHFVI